MEVPHIPRRARLRFRIGKPPYGAAERFFCVARRQYVALDICGVAGEYYPRPVCLKREYARGVVEVFETLRPNVLLSAEHVKAKIAQ